MLTFRKVVGAAAVLAVVVSLGASGPAGSAPAPTPAAVLAGHTIDGSAIPCDVQSDGVQVCHGSSTGPGGEDLRVKSFDGTPLDIYVTLPSGATPGTGSPYPLIVQSHGWGAPPSGATDPQYGGPTAEGWAEKGYVVVQLTARGWGDSCGTAASRAVAPTACAHGYIRLDDARYEIRDIQYVVGLLVDEGLADPARIGAIGESYGGGATLELATLNDRVMQPDGSLAPWRSPDGVPLHIAAAVPLYAWSDLVTALLPNGRTLDDRVTPAADDLSPLGVWKQSIDTGLYLVGQASGYYAPTGSDPEADVTAWYQALSTGNPSATPGIEAIAELIARYHSAYQMLAGTFGVTPQQPPPMLFVQGFTDEVFPTDETLRYVNLERSRYPDAQVGMFFFDGGHQRAQNKPADGALTFTRITDFFDHHLQGVGAAPVGGVTALTQTCPADAPSGGPFQAADWNALHPGTVTFGSAPAQTVSSAAGDTDVAKALDPVLGGLACTTVPATDQGAGVATYRLPTVTGVGYTLLGAPSITAHIDTTGSNAFLAARLFDVDPTTGTEVLVSRGVYRIDPDAPDGSVTIPLEANGWHFAAGHVPKVELLGQDAPYLGASPVPFTVNVSDVVVSLPTHEANPVSPTSSTTTTTTSTTTSVPASTTSVPRSTGRPPGNGHASTMTSRPATPVAAQPTFTG